jgi:hypothetical protein
MATKTNPYSADTAIDRLAIASDYRRTQERERYRIEIANPDDGRLESMTEDILRAQEKEKAAQAEVDKLNEAAAS